jgi:amino acid transporter
VLQHYDIGLGLAALLALTWLNLRGIRESGTVFAAPTYVFVFALLGMLGWGLWRVASGGIPYQPGDPGPAAGTQALSWFLILSAFAKGCSAMTGTEAISNAVPAFQPPESRNARLTLLAMASLLALMVLAIAFLVTTVGLVPDPDEHETVLAALTRLVVGDGWYFYLVQFATATILFLAANTSYAGFPWLLSVLARDRYVPRWFGLRGDRLAFSSGIFFLSALSAVLLVAFAGSVERLLPLYAIGVFAAFTLSQAGMVAHWLRGDEPGRIRSAVVNGVGAVTTGAATLVIGVNNFTQGAWMVIVIVPLLMALSNSIRGHYDSAARQLSERKPRGEPATAPLVLVPIPNLGPLALDAVSFARSLGPRVVAVHVATDPEEARQLRQRWDEMGQGSSLILIESPYRLLIPPLLAYIDALRELENDGPLLVVVPELVPKRWWEHLLHNQTALRLKGALLVRRGVTVVSMPYHLD